MDVLNLPCEESFLLIHNIWRYGVHGVNDSLASVDHRRTCSISNSKHRTSLKPDQTQTNKNFIHFGYSISSLAKQMQS